MPGVLVESSASSPHCFFPFEPSVPHSSCPDNSHGGLGNISSSADPRPHSPHSPVPLSNHLSHLDILARSPPSPASYTSRELAQRLLLRSNLGPPLSAPVTTDFSIDSSSEFGVPIPSPRKGLYCTANSSDAMVGSPLLSEPNGMGSPVFSDAFSALQKFLPSNTDDDDDVWRTDTLPAMDNFSCDDFRMYEFKVRRCMRGRSHDWTECPFAHPGEKARRRDPRRFHYSGTACPDFRKGACKRGDACEYAHGVFECWLHPARYRTQPCKDGRACRRRVCFFAHTVEQLRILPSVPTSSSSVCLSVGNGVESPCKMLPTQETNPLRLSMNTNEYNVSIDESPVSPHLQKILENRSFGSLGLGFSPSLTTALQGVSGSSSPILSPAISPSTSPPTSTDGFWTARLVPTKSPLSNVSAVPGHRRHLNRLQTMPTISIPQDSSELSDTCAFEGMSFSLPASAHMQYSRGNVDEILHSLQALQLQSRNAEMQRCSSTPSSPHTLKHSAVQHSSVGQCRYRSIPSTPTLSSGIWDVATSRVSEDEPALRVESGRSLRAEIYGKIGKDNGVSVCGEVPDLGWVNELVK